MLPGLADDHGIRALGIPGRLFRFYNPISLVPPNCLAAFVAVVAFRPVGLDLRPPIRLMHVRKERSRQSSFLGRGLQYL